MNLRVLIVDDSALVRRLLSDILSQAGGFETQTARNGREGVELAKTFDPAVITMDVNMPEMDGLTALSHIMADRPRPVVMLSSITTRDAPATLQALGMGAVDCIPKPDGTISSAIVNYSAEIVARIRAAAAARIRPLRGKPLGAATTSPPFRPAPAQLAPRPKGSYRDHPVVLLGCSTGGPRTLDEIIPRLPEDFPAPVVVALHIPETFTAALAERLNAASRVRVVELANCTELLPGTAYIARGDADVVVSTRSGTLQGVSVTRDPRLTWHPSVERLVRSALEALPPKQLVAVQLTGMGDDGAAAMCDLRAAGGRTIAESEETATVYGMPRALVEGGGAEYALPSYRIAEVLNRIVRERRWV